jgi:hypothetical protein
MKGTLTSYLPIRRGGCIAALEIVFEPLPDRPSMKFAAFALNEMSCR